MPVTSLPYRLPPGVTASGTVDAEARGAVTGGRLTGAGEIRLLGAGLDTDYEGEAIAIDFATAMAGVSLAWNLSSLHFAGEEDPSAYQTVHTVLVGVRGLGAPFLGFAVIRAASTLHGFALSAALFMLAALLMARMARAAGRVPADVPASAERLD